MAEWSKATDCKSVSKTHIGSNPIFLIIKKSIFYNSFKNKLRKKSKLIFYIKLSKTHQGISRVGILHYYKSYIYNFYYSQPDVLLPLNSISKIEYIISCFNNLSNVYLQKITDIWYSFLWFDDCWKFVFENIVKKQMLNLIGFFRTNSQFDFLKSRILNLNFKRKRFFPVIRDFKGTTFFNMSLGIVAKYLKKEKCFTKKKPVFLLVASFLRKILLFSSLTKLVLMIKRTPMFLQEILSIINNPVSNLYEHPFNKQEVNEFKITNPFYFSNVVFTTTKPYGPVKTKNKGRLKRKITKKLNLIGRVID